jgi:hypothetical protein
VWVRKKEKEARNTAGCRGGDVLVAFDSVEGGKRVLNSSLNGLQLVGGRKEPLAAVPLVEGVKLAGRGEEMPGAETLSYPTSVRTSTSTLDRLLH